MVYLLPTGLHLGLHLVLHSSLRRCLRMGLAVRFLGVLVLVVGLCALGVAPAHGQEDSPLKVAFVYLGPIGDHGWSYGHEQGRLAVQKHFGAQVETHFVEKIPEGPESERVFARLIQDGYKLIFANGYGHTRSAIRAARLDPEVRLEVATGSETSPQVALYSARFYEGRYIAGVIAGHLSQSGTAGYIASLPVPEVVRGINAFLLGMRSVNPDARLRLAWVHAWYDPPREADAARVLIGRGADILTQHTDSTAALGVAAEQGVKAFGLASDMHHFAPEIHLSSIVNLWDSYYIERVSAYLDGTWQSGRAWRGFDGGMLEMSAYHNMPAEVAEAARRVEAQIRAGDLQIFAGPLIDQAGAQRIAAGAVLDDTALLSMDWFLDGVDGSLP